MMEEDFQISPPTAEETRDHVGLWDYLLALGVAAGVFALMKLWAFPGIYPAAWDDLAVAVGLRPVAQVAPGLWFVFARALSRYLSVPATLATLKALGPVVVACMAGVTYLLFREVLAILSRMRLKFSSLRLLVVRTAAFFGAFFFGCSDPIWRAGQIFMPVTELLALTVLAVYFFFVFLRGGRLVNGYAATFLMGLLSGETPIGFILLGVVGGVYFIAARKLRDLDMPLLNPFIGQISKWHLTFIYVLGLLSVIALNCLAFSWFDGLAATGCSTGDLPVNYAVRFWHLFTTAATPLGWVMAVGVVLLPATLAVGLLPRAVDDEQFLPYHIGILYLATGILAFTQVVSLDALWMWTWVTKPLAFQSPFLLGLLMLLAALTVTCALAVLGVNSFCRNHRRLVQQRFSEMRLEAGDDQLFVSKGFLGVVRRVVFLILPLILLAMVIPGRRLRVPRECLALLRDYVREVVTESKGATWIFTDGSFDAAYELMAAEQGYKLRAMSMMSANSLRDIWIRSRDLLDDEDRLTMKSGSAATLRTWVRDKPARLSACALQLGFEMWKRDGRQPPPVTGVVCRPSGLDDASCARGLAAADELVQRFLDFYRREGLSRASGEQINRLMLFAQWRLSRLLRVRAEQADLAGRTDEAVAYIKLADELDDSNEAIKQIRENMERMRQMMMRQMTPREGLQLALVRADFNLARKYAEPILTADPDEPNANFGMGMSYFVEKQWARAEEYLRRCLVRKPQEPAIYNNLAIIQLNTGRYEAALRNARKALAIIPESSEVKDTIRQIEKAVSKATVATPASSKE